MNNPFTYFITKNNKLIISRNNKQIKIVKGKQCDDFIQIMHTGDEEAIQLKLAKLTGHYKHGNEKK